MFSKRDKESRNECHAGCPEVQQNGSGKEIIADLRKSYMASKHEASRSGGVPSIVEMVQMSETLAHCSASQYWSSNESSCSLTAEVPGFVLLTPPTNTSSLVISTENSKPSVHNFIASLSDCTAPSVGWLEPKRIPDNKTIPDDTPEILITPPTPELSLLDIAEREKAPESLSTLETPAAILNDSELKLEVSSIEFTVSSSSSLTTVTMDDFEESFSDFDDFILDNPLNLCEDDEFTSATLIPDIDNPPNLSDDNEFISATTTKTIPTITVTPPTPASSLINIQYKASHLPDDNEFIQ